MHFERTGQVVPQEGVVFVRIYSNIDLLENKVPETIFDMLPEPSTLAQGKKSVESQFRYGTRESEGGRMTISFASFRLSFAVLAITSADLASISSDELPKEATPYRPGALQAVMPRNFSAKTLFRVQ